MLDINNFDAIRIGLASSEKIRAWSSGEVTKPETINYRTLKPEKDGLFCERIFGPTKDWECYCGKYKRVRYKGIICERCGVEVTRSKVRRERMGHIDLAAPVSHIWFFKGVPSRMGYLLDIAPKELEKVLYFAGSIVTFIDEEKRAADHEQLQEKVSAAIEQLHADKLERNQELEEARERRLRVLDGEATPEEIEMEALAIYGGTEAKLRKLTKKEVSERKLQVEREINDEIIDNDRYAEEQAKRLEQLWEEFQKLEVKQIIGDEQLFRDLKDRFGSPFGLGNYFRGGMGAEAIRELLEQVNLQVEVDDLNEQVIASKGQKLQRAIKRLKVMDAFLRSGNRPEWMILESVPVIPPELRPMVQLDGGRFATSDLNDLYRRVINRNNRLKRLLDLGAPEIIVNNEKRMLQEAVDALFDNGRRGRAVTGPGNRPLKSLSDMLKGKQGRFRQNLLGKRVDYSGRSVIVAGPELKLHQCGVPKLMALELFKPFIMSRLVERDRVQNIKAAKKMVESMVPEVWDVLEEVISEHPVMLNRAPTLHRLGIQAFEPILVEGKAIQIHPLVCAAFNADFDGDQMAVHVPLSVEAQAEARILMLSANNILSPAHGRPLAVPSQDMVLGTYWLTYCEVNVDDLDPQKMKPTPPVFGTADEVMRAVDEKTVKLQQVVRFRRADGSRIVTTAGRVIFDDEIDKALRDHLGDEYDPGARKFVNETLDKSRMKNLIADLINQYGAVTVARLLDVIKKLGFEHATLAGVTVGKNDIVVPPEKGEILDRYEAEVEEVHSQYDRGFITDGERREMVIQKWQQATDEVAEAMDNNLYELNPLFMMANSGARGNPDQMHQLAGMRGLMLNPKGDTIERPVKASLMEGMSVLEFFISTHGSRKGLADTALRTADSGYLTRRLVDVAQDVIIREEDCGTEDYLELPLRVADKKSRSTKLNESLIGRVLALDVPGKRKPQIIAEKGTHITDSVIAAIDEVHGEKEVYVVPVRSVLKCEAEVGVCGACYGRNLASGELAEIGDAVGIIAAQSIGEPGTQLTMRTFHRGGIAGEDITHGLPRVVELFEARKPKGQAKIAEIGGKVELVDTDKSLKVIVHGAKGEEKSYSFPRHTRLFVKDGDKIEQGAQLSEGSLYPGDLVAVRGNTETELYLVNEVQDVYRRQGVDINDKHIEIVVRQMMKRLRVESRGDTDLLPGQLVDRVQFKKINEQAAATGGEPANAEQAILGITKASLATESFLSAASFQETTKVLTDASIEGKVDHLLGLKENVIIGKLIPASTGLRHYRMLEIFSTEPMRRAEEMLAVGAPSEEGEEE
ncbi:MAG: DNA-directed RNA polymerase subunit beta' [Thermoleophilia bacterium]|nr:DNA-directed RNA polymerase subunit beta' [Actinomycetota bacterium]MCL6092824.1 DNA-directed RNA polymerase subunit beta' [Actinomycetota bacterium]